MNTNQIMMSSLAVLALSCSSALAAATSGTCGGNCKWELDGSTLKILGSGPMADYTNNAERPWDGLSSSISSVVVSDGITTVGTRAFRDMNNLTSVSIGKDVTSIGNTAFIDNTSLTTVSFSKDSALTNIGTSAFGCNSGKTNQLKEINIPSTVKTIGDRAFRYSGLQSVNFGDNSQLTTIGENAFLGNTSLQNVNFGDNSQLTTIGSSAFSGNMKLESVDFGDNSKLESIGDHAFFSNVKLGTSSDPNTEGSFTIPASVKTIGKGAFDGDNFDILIFEEGSKLSSVGFQAFIGKIGTIIGLDEVIDTLLASSDAFHIDYNRPCKADGTHTYTGRLDPKFSGKYYCKDMIACQNFIQYLIDSGEANSRAAFEYSYDKKTGRYMSGGKLYASIQDLLSGKFINIRRIYTVKEATEAVSPKGRNTFTIRYR